MKPFFLALCASGILFGCEENKIDTAPPPPPQGIVTISLDNSVELQWLPSQADDVRGYTIWVSNRYDGEYTSIGAASATHFIDYGATNGVTVYYAISAFDYNDNESEFSRDVVYDTPRPEGYNVVLTDYLLTPSYAGYSFSEYSILPYNDDFTDMFFARSNGNSFLYVWDDTDIQDMGYTSTLDDISSAPVNGWAPSGTAEAIPGHTYILRTWNMHYAKVRVIEAGPNRLLFDWAYQTAQGNPELYITQKNNSERKPLSRSSAIQ